MNKVILIGRTTRDADVRYSQGTNLAVAKFNLAVERKFKKDGEQGADFINCIAFGKTAEVIEKYVVQHHHTLDFHLSGRAWVFQICSDIF